MFDPYSEWLGIAEERRPPTLYQILGLAPAEANSPAIEAAVTRQLARVQSHLSGPHSKDAWRMIDEITLAKGTLLDPAKRAAYDAVFGFGSKSSAPPRATPTAIGAAWGQAASPSPPSPATPWYASEPAAAAASSPPQSAAPWYLPPSPKPVPAFQPPITPAPKAAVPVRPVAPVLPPVRVPPGNILDDAEPTSSDGFPSATALVAPRRKRDASRIVPIGGGVLALGLVAGIAYFVTREPMPSPENPKQDVADNTHPTPGIAVISSKEKKERDHSIPKKKPPEKKKITPPKDDPPPPLEIVGEFKQAKVFRGHELAPKSLAMSPDGKQLLSTGDDLLVYSWTPDKDKPSRRMTLESPPAVGVGFLPGGKQAVAVDGGFIKIIDLADNVVRKKIATTDGGFQGLAIGDGQHILTCSNDGKLRWWNIGKDTPEQTMTASGMSLDAVALSSDGKTAIAGGKDGFLSSWDLTNGKLIKKWKASTGPILAVAFSPDGKVVVSTGDKLGKAWDATSGSPLFTLKGHTDEVTAVAFTTDGGMILTASADKTLRSWDAVTGEPLRWSFKADGKLRSLAIDPKDRFAFVGMGDGGIQLLLLPVVRPDSPPRNSLAQAPKSPLSTPMAASVESVLPSIREKYKNDYAQTGADDRLALFDKLMTRARLGENEPAMRFALFREASDLASQLGRMDESFKAISARAVWFETDELAEKAAALKKVEPGTVGKTTVEAAIAVVEDAEKRVRPDIVDELLRQRELFPVSDDAPELKAKVQAAEKRWIAAAAERETIRKLVDDFKKEPNAPALNAQLGKHLCFRLGEWTEGLPHLAKGDDAILKDLAKRELALPTDAKAQADLGKAWFDYAAKAEDTAKPGILLRAKAWSEKAVAELPGVKREPLPPAERLPIGNRLGEINKQIAAVSSVAPVRPGEAVTRHAFNTMRSQLALETQWTPVGSEGFTPEVVLLKANASMTSRFKILDGCRLEFALIPDGREVKIQLNGTETVFKPAAGGVAILLTVERKGNDVKSVLKTATGTMLEEKSAPILAAKQEPGALAFSVSGASEKEGLRLKSIVVNGPVKPGE